MVGKSADKLKVLKVFPEQFLTLVPRAYDLLVSGYNRAIISRNREGSGDENDSSGSVFELFSVNVRTLCKKRGQDAKLLNHFS